MHFNLAVVGPVAVLGLFLAAWRGPPGGACARCRPSLVCGPTGSVTAQHEGPLGTGIELVSAARWVLTVEFPQRSPCSLTLVL